MFLAGGFRPDASPQLPIQIEFCDKGEYKALSRPSASPLLTGVSVAAEDAVLSAVISSTSSSTLHCGLLPAYVLYAAGRFALQQQHRRGAQVTGPSHRVTRITNKMVAMMRKVVQARDQEIKRMSVEGFVLTLDLGLPRRASRPSPEPRPFGWPTPPNCSTSSRTMTL